MDTLQVIIQIDTQAAVRCNNATAGKAAVVLTAEFLQTLTQEEREYLAGQSTGTREIDLTRAKSHKIGAATLEEVKKLLEAEVESNAQEERRNHEDIKKFMATGMMYETGGFWKRAEPPWHLAKVTRWPVELQEQYEKRKPQVDEEIAHRNQEIARSKKAEILTEISAGKLGWRGSVEQLKYRLDSTEYAELEREYDQLEEQQKREKKEKEAQEKRAFLEERAQWIVEHGSPHLQRLMADGYPLNETYKKERFAKERPGWLWEADQCGDPVAIRDPKPKWLDALDRMKARGIECQLMWLDDARHVHGCEHDASTPREFGEDVEDFEQRPILISQFLGQEVWHEVRCLKPCCTTPADAIPAGAAIALNRASQKDPE